MKRAKKILAVAITSIMLCGVALTAGAAEGVHKHAYSYGETKCHHSSNVHTHPYVAETVTYPSGKVEIKYGSCQVVKYHYKDIYRCGCNAYYYTDEYVKLWHANCGIGWE